MAIRNIRVMGDDILTKKCKPVKEMTEKNKQLVEDMLETMYEADGVGLAAHHPIVLVNPEIVKAEGEQRGSEGCLSVPDKVGIVIRPNKVKVKAFDTNMKPVTIKGEDLLARALVHEIEHLEGILYVDRLEGRLYDVDEFEEEE